MILRLALLLMLLVAAPAYAQAPPVGARAPISISDQQMCASRGIAEDPTDIDTATCKSFRNAGEVDSQKRIVWVRARVDIPPGYIDAAPIAVFTGALAAREIWWNGQLIGGSGHPGRSRAEEIPGQLDEVTWIKPDLLQATNRLEIRYSTFHLDMRIRTPLHFLVVAPMGDPQLRWMSSYVPGLAATGALVAAALFFGFAWAMDRRSPAPLFIAIMSTCAVGQLWLESMRGFISFPYPMQIPRLVAIAALALAFALSMTAYVARRFAPQRWRLHVAIAAGIAIALPPFLPGFDGATLGFILAPSIVAFAAALQGVMAKRPGAIATTAALTVFIVLMGIENAGFLNRTFYLAVSFLALVLFIDQVRALRRAREAEEQAKRRAALLELELLRRRIAPHFLMNTLNALAEWVEQDPKTGVKMIEALAEEFRLLSQISDRPLIPLGEELALCRRHLEVMSYRVDRSFSLATRNIDERAEVPPGVIHTLIENAFTHDRFATGGEFTLTRETGDDGERLVLLAPPADQSGPAKQPGGEGLAYVRRRLEAAFGAGASVESAASASGWRTVLFIPA